MLRSLCAPVSALISTKIFVCAPFLSHAPILVATMCHETGLAEFESDEIIDKRTLRGHGHD